MKLISMTDLVLKDNFGSYENLYVKHLKYANFLKQPLNLGMFVPCDLEGNFLEEPDGDNYKSDEEKDIPNFDYIKYKNDSKEYQEAKDRVLFRGKFEVCSERQLIRFNKLMQPLECLSVVENLVKYNLNLSESAIKQLEL